ncbi:MAG: hypothetical protein C0513_04450 [Isosphaera sp.]|nr:hypothetical protein [Isosphaera sp.]
MSQHGGANTAAGDDGATQLEPAERAVVWALQGLRPARPSGSGDDVLYWAGVAAGRRQMRRWRAAAQGLSVVLAGSLAWIGAVPGGVRPGEVIAAAPTQSPDPAPIAQSAEPAPLLGSEPRGGLLSLVLGTPRPDRSSLRSYLELRRGVIERGLDALPEPSPRAAAAEAARPRIRSGATLRELSRPLGIWRVGHYEE